MPLRKRKASVTLKRPRIRQSHTKAKALKSLSGKDDIIIKLSKRQDFAWVIEQIKRDFPDKKETAMPQDLKPMLASVSDEAFNDADWQFEIKWDGYRALSYLSNGKAEMRSRNNLSFNKKYPSLQKALKDWPVNAVVDGEVVILKENGRADFAALQQWDKEQRGELLYYVFDLLWVEGIDLRNEPLTLRKELLKKLMPDAGPLRYSDSIDEWGVGFFIAAKENCLEGIIAKQKDAPYRNGTRTENWLKIKAEKRHEVIICGYTKKRNSDRQFSSLVVGIPDTKGDLKFIGQVGTGFSVSTQTEILKELSPLETTACPFKNRPVLNGAVQWVEPSLLCEVKYTQLTKEGVMRHPSFQGLRLDKSAAEINLEETKSKRNGSDIPFGQGEAKS